MCVAVYEQQQVVSPNRNVNLPNVVSGSSQHSVFWRTSGPRRIMPSRRGIGTVWAGDSFGVWISASRLPAIALSTTAATATESTTTPARALHWFRFIDCERAATQLRAMQRRDRRGRFSI